MIVFRLPFLSLITTFSRNVFINTVAIFRLPLGLPWGCRTVLAGSVSLPGVFGIRPFLLSHRRSYFSSCT